MSSEPSLLELISEKEETLKRESDLVCTECDEIIVKARKQAVLILESAELEGKREADSLYDQHILALSQEISTMCEEGDRESERIRRRGEHNLPRAVSMIIDAVTG